MICRRKSSSRVPLLVLLPILVAGITGTALAYCPWEGAPGCVPSGAPPYSMCDRNVASNVSCQAPMNNGAGTVCVPSIADTSAINFFATQTMAADRAAAFCRWQCTTSGTAGSANCRINLSDGLPVELMEFSVGSDEPDGDGDDRQEGAEDEEG